MFIDHVGEVKFSGERETGAGRTVLHSPERAVFGLGAGWMTLVEVAPGSSSDAPSSPG
jgi:propionate CoA-transferase